MAASTPREEIEHFLHVLEKRIRQLGDTVAAAADGLDPESPEISFADYVRSRDLSSECWAFSIVIERRLDDYQGPDKTKMRERFDDLTINIWSMLLSCSLYFLDSLSRREYLPIGSREIFVREIKTLYDAHKLLADPRYEHRITDTLRRQHHRAERILNEIIERAPALLNLA
ncbi:hypothetical protein ACM64Y_13495 [Novispirillum sp. DQ9]|uniref:hypothetical protein n=1 Tax=Novispirillum sp. DQ9 TaxID=3398612 RepID=UPI003C7D4031